MEVSKEEILSILEDMYYWEELAKLLQWKLTGFSERETAIFSTSNDESLVLTSRQRDDIVISIMENIPTKP